MRNTVIAIIIASFVGAGFLFVALSNKNAGERRFVFNYEKGVYHGPTDPPLAPATLDALRQRAVYQAAADGEVGPLVVMETEGGNVRIGEGAGSR